MLLIIQNDKNKYTFFKQEPSSLKSHTSATIEMNQFKNIYNPNVHKYVIDLTGDMESTLFKAMSKKNLSTYKDVLLIKKGEPNYIFFNYEAIFEKYKLLPEGPKKLKLLEQQKQIEEFFKVLIAKEEKIKELETEAYKKGVVLNQYLEVEDTKKTLILVKDIEDIPVAPKENEDFITVNELWFVKAIFSELNGAKFTT